MSLLLSPVVAWIVAGSAATACLVLWRALGRAHRVTEGHRDAIGRVQEAADAAQRRLSHELHDEVGQKLALLKMQLQLSQLSRDATASAQEASISLVDSLLADVRSLSHALTPVPFQAGQLIPALTALARSEGRRAGVCVLVDAPIQGVTLSHDVELTCYRVIREAFSNIAKHAAATHVAISVAQLGDSLAFSVDDDGRGFDVATARSRTARHGRLGLLGMRERIADVGGSLTIRSHRGAGTTIVCQVPVNGAA